MEVKVVRFPDFENYLKIANNRFKRDWQSRATF